MHHPGCWVTNSGCATQTDHRRTPLAQAYSIGRPAGAEAPHPGEGLRVAPALRTVYPTDPIVAPLRQQRPADPRPTVGVDSEGWPIIGGSVAPPGGHKARAEYLAGQPLGAPAGSYVPQRRYMPPAHDGSAAARPLPQIYRQHHLLGYWYVPVGLLLAAGVALGVIWFVGLFTGSAPSKSAPATPPATSAAAAASSPAASPVASTAAGASVTTVATAGQFAIGDVLAVTGTAPDCLNVRTGPARANPAIVCLKDGEAVTVTGGPETGDGLTWWKVKTKLGEGWAAQDYLTKQP